MGVGRRVCHRTSEGVGPTARPTRAAATVPAGSGADGTGVPSVPALASESTPPPQLAPFLLVDQGLLSLAAYRLVLKATGNDCDRLHAGFTPQAGKENIAETIENIRAYILSGNPNSEVDLDLMY